MGRGESVDRGDAGESGERIEEVLYDYDYLGRRVQRVVHSWNPTGGGGSGAWNSTADECQRTVYHNWLPLIEFDGLNSNAALRRWTWGLDLAGLNGGAGSGGAGILPAIDSAGGIGGLLATYETGGTKAYIYFHDGNGNVGQLIDPLASTVSAALVARYEYDAYGNVTSSGGAYAATNRMQFSTKPWDAVTGLGYWGYRWYSPRIGRWTSRDPVGEEGSFNTLSAFSENPILRIDAIGLAPDEMRDLAHLCGWRPDPSNPQRGPTSLPPPIPLPDSPTPPEITFLMDLRAIAEYATANGQGCISFDALVAVVGPATVWLSVEACGKVHQCCCDGKQRIQKEVSVTGSIKAQIGGSVGTNGGPKTGKLPSGGRAGRNTPVSQPGVLGGPCKNKNRATYKDGASPGGLTGGQDFGTKAGGCSCECGVSGKASIKVDAKAGVIVGVGATAECAWSFPGGAECTAGWYAGVGILGAEVTASGNASAVVKWFD